MSTTDTTEAVILTGDAFDLLRVAGGLVHGIEVGPDLHDGGNPQHVHCALALTAALTAFSDRLRADGDDEAQYELVVSLRRV